MTDPPSWGEQREILFELQGGACGVCQRPLSGRYALDHDHATGLTRGLLCHGCNSREGGRFEDPSDQEMAAYLAHPPAERFGWTWRDPSGRTQLETEVQHRFDHDLRFQAAVQDRIDEALMPALLPKDPGQTP